MSRSCGAVQNYFRQVDFYPAMRRNQAMLESVSAAAARTGRGAARSFPDRIPVVVHVLHNTPEDDVSDEQVASQIEVLNEDFTGANADLGQVPEPFRDRVGNPGLTFHLAEQDPMGNPTDGITRRQTDVVEFAVDDSMKDTSRGGTSPWDATRYLNIWVCRLSNGVLGYAQFPGGPPDTDGVVVLTSAFGRRGSAVGPFDLGRTATHEIGHYLNLSHIWGEARVPTCSDSDFVDDTPNQWGPNSGKPTFPSTSCGNTPHGDMFVNYMDYVDDDTMCMFTEEQVSRMHATLEFSRSGLGSAAGSPILTGI
ncbi:zinc metalloprotease [Blastococcus sp. CCUG 61487]|uniref:zinc metalloprotease n=1 Tax=Blastococcus sp. CCUG 61487 TaxID=1840703 RepID=UPI0010C054F8|nr:zinc metalloprotease [Blastococcus sp. CCUG 61487]TKJ17972.1 Ulilysin [Blastococcus sp. CCUG 61487]